MLLLHLRMAGLPIRLSCCFLLQLLGETVPLRLEMLVRLFQMG